MSSFNDFSSVAILTILLAARSLLWFFPKSERTSASSTLAFSLFFSACPSSSSSTSSLSLSLMAKRPFLFSFPCLAEPHSRHPHPSVPQCLPAWSQCSWPWSIPKLQPFGTLQRTFGAFAVCPCSDSLGSERIGTHVCLWDPFCKKYCPWTPQKGWDAGSWTIKTKAASSTALVC